MSHISARRPLTRGEKLLFIGCPLLLSLLALGTRVHSIREEDPIINFPKVPRVPNPNGYDLYLQAMKAIVPAQVSVDPVDDSVPPTTAAARAQRYSLARRRAWLGANTRAFFLFDQALKMPSAYPHPRGTMTVSGDSSKFRQLAREQVKRANTYKLEKQWGLAAQAGLDGVQMGNDTAKGGWLFPKLVSTAVVAISLSTLTDFDDVPGHLNASEARVAAKRLENLIEQMPTYQQAMEAERWSNLMAFLKTTKQAKWRSFGDEDVETGGASWRQKLTARLISKSEIVRRINTRYDIILKDLRSPYHASTNLKPNDLDILTRQFSSFMLPRWLQGREQVAMRLLLLRFALQAYKTEHGAYPASLHQLAPSYLKRVPTDYYADEAPFHYKIQKGKYRLWSIGPDGVNNGGSPILTNKKLLPGEPPKPASVSPKSKGDWVVGLNR